MIKEFEDNWKREKDKDNRKMNGTDPAEKKTELKKRGDTRPALEDCTLEAIGDLIAIILRNSVQLVESELPLSEAVNCDELSGKFLFRQIISSYDATLQCLFCRNKYSPRFPADLEKHYRMIHKLVVLTSKAEFNENNMFVCVPADINEETTLNSGCRYCETTMKTLSEVRDHYTNAHNKRVRLLPEADVTEIGNYFYCGLCGYASVDFTSHRQHMKSMHRVQTYVCRYCNYCTSRPSRLQTHVKQRHLQNQPGPHLQCSVCSVYVHGKDRLTKHIMLSHAVQTGPKTWSCAKCLFPYGDPQELMNHIPSCPKLQPIHEAKTLESGSNPTSMFYKCNHCFPTFSSEEEIKLKKGGDTRPALEDCTFEAIDDLNAILPNSVQLVESDLPLSEADNYDKLSGMFLFRQIFSKYDLILLCLFCGYKYSLRSPADLEKHYHVIHELTVHTSKAEFNENKKFVCVPADVNEETTLNSGCSYCETTLKTLSEVRDHYTNVHNKSVRLLPEADVIEIGNFFYCGLCGYASVDFTSHHQHMKSIHRMQTCVPLL